jgi:C4-type Zn-finger protein
VCVLVAFADTVQSDTATVTIPEIELELAPGTLGAKFTTVEGLLQVPLPYSRLSSECDSSCTEENSVTAMGGAHIRRTSNSTCRIRPLWLATPSPLPRKRNLRGS